ncbi:MAG: hypothetical protein K2Y23_11625 [Cyanobacteria bacterium]|nr:hypothetical protein [Cyanobacteriota bacterium]
MRASCCSAGKLPRPRPAPRVTEIHAGSVITGNGWKVTAGHAQHAQPYPECVALRLDTNEGSICYSGDSGGVVDCLVQLTEQIDQPTIRGQIVHEIRQVFDGKLVWGEDLMKLGVVNAQVSTIERRQPAG